MSLADAYEKQREINFKKFLDGVEGVCEATTFERWSLQAELEQAGHKYKINPGGVSRTLGYIGKRSKGRCVVFTFWSTMVNDKKILLAEPTSRWTDWDMLRDFCKEYLPNIPLTNAENFGNLL